MDTYNICALTKKGRLVYFSTMPCETEDDAIDAAKDVIWSHYWDLPEWVHAIPEMEWWKVYDANIDNWEESAAAMIELVKGRTHSGMDVLSSEELTSYGIDVYLWDTFAGILEDVPGVVGTCVWEYGIDVDMDTDMCPLYEEEEEEEE